MTPPVKIAEVDMKIPKAETYNIVDIEPVNTVPNGRYEMYVTASSAYAYWLVNSSDVYARGVAIIDSIKDSSQDFVFATFGFNDTPPAEPSSPPEVEVDETPTAGDVVADSVDAEANTESASSGDTISDSATSTTSSSISAPTNLKAQVVSENTSSSIDLSWTASKTSGIDGYVVYRSASEDTGFVEIAKTDVKTLNYRDDKAVTDQTYYYAVKAYKDTNFSDNSNIASAKITDTIAPQTPQNFKILNQGENEIEFSWDETTDTDIANYILTIVNSGEEGAETIEVVDTIEKIATKYTLKLSEHEVLSQNKSYTFYLQAKDVSNNYSEKAETAGGFISVVVEKENNDLILFGGGVALIVLIAIVTYLIIRKHKKHLLT